jgi:predicted nucleic acid-binding protein
MSDRYFLDTNILIYTFDRHDEAKRARASGLVEEALSTGRGVISSQVVQEFLNVATRKFATPMATSEALRYLDDVLAPMCEVYPSIDLFERALLLREATRYALYDSLIVAAALQAGCRTLFTEDMQDGRQFEGLLVKDPFRP